jgi:hypothetical protein
MAKKLLSKRISNKPYTKTSKVYSALKGSSIPFDICYLLFPGNRVGPFKKICA